jgi:hypothetical protein
MPRTNSFKSDYSGSSKFSKEFNQIKNSEVGQFLKEILVKPLFLNIIFKKEILKGISI